MYLCLHLLLVIGVVASRPQDDPDFYRVESKSADGQYAFQYKTGAGTLVQEQGALKRAADGKSNILVAKGLYKYQSPEGVPVEIAYTADENGFVATGDIIPKHVQPTG